MRATGVNPVTPLRLSASQASLLFPFFFSVPCAPLWLRGAWAPFASPRPQQVPLSSPTLLLPWLWLDSVSWVISHQKSKRSKKRGMILQLSCPSERSGAEEGAEGAGRAWARAEGLPPPLALAGSARPQHGFVPRSQLGLVVFSACNYLV